MADRINTDNKHQWGTEGLKGGLHKHFDLGGTAVDDSTKLKDDYSFLGPLGLISNLLSEQKFEGISCWWELEIPSFSRPVSPFLFVACEGTQEDRCVALGAGR